MATAQHVLSRQHKVSEELSANRMRKKERNEKLREKTESQLLGPTVQKFVCCQKLHIVNNIQLYQLCQLETYTVECAAIITTCTRNLLHCKTLSKSFACAIALFVALFCMCERTFSVGYPYAMFTQPTYEMRDSLDSSSTRSISASRLHVSHAERARAHQRSV